MPGRLQLCSANDEPALAKSNENNKLSMEALATNSTNTMRLNLLSVSKLSTCMSLGASEHDPERFTPNTRSGDFVLDSVCNVEGLSRKKESNDNTDGAKQAQLFKVRSALVPAQLKADDELP